MSQDKITPQYLSTTLQLLDNEDGDDTTYLREIARQLTIGNLLKLRELEALKSAAQSLHNLDAEGIVVTTNQS